MLVLDVGVLSDSVEETSLLCSSCGSITATLAVTISAAVQNIVEDEPSGVQRQIRSVKRKFIITKYTFYILFLILCTRLFFVF